MAETKITPDIASGSSQFQVQAENLERKERGERLRSAVRKAGGARRVAQRSGVAFGTLNNYLAGGEIKLTAAAALARACGVSLEWLATGVESESLPPPESQTSGTQASQILANMAADAPQGPRTNPIWDGPSLFSFVDVDTITAAVEAVIKGFESNGIEPRMREVMQASLLLYDMMKEASRPSGADSVAGAKG